MKVLLLGSNGQLGSDIRSAYRLLRPRFDLIPLTRRDLDVSRVENLKVALPRYEFDVLINCTSYHKTDEAENNPTLAFTVNAHAVQAMAEVCQTKGARFIHISTDYVFNGDGTKPYVETDLPRPINMYGASKAMGETLAQLSHDQLYILRTASLFGLVGASGKGGNFVERILQQAAKAGEVRVVSDIVMSPTSSTDLADVICTLVERRPKPGIYHAVNSGQASWYEFALEIFARAGMRTKVVPVTSEELSMPARRPAYSVLSNRKLASAIGEVPHWTDALEQYLRLKQQIA